MKEKDRVERKMNESEERKNKNILLRKHAYSNILKILQKKKKKKKKKKKMEKFKQKKNLIFSAHIYCGYSLEPPRWGGSYEYLQSMF